MTTEHVINIGVLASGQGSTAAHLHQHLQDGELQDISEQCSIKLVVSNNSKAGIASYCQDEALNFEHISGVTHPDSEQLAIAKAFKTAEVNVVLALGYMKKIGPEIFNNFPSFNCHPAYLPGLFDPDEHPMTFIGGVGMHGQELFKQAVTSDKLYTGSTFHIIDANYDRGPCLMASRPVRIEKSGSLEARIAKLETDIKASEKNALLNFVKDIQQHIQHWKQFQYSLKLNHESTEPNEVCL